MPQHMEVSLDENQQTLTLALRAGRMGTWELDLDLLKLGCSAQCKQNFGRPPAEEFTYQKLADCIFPEDLERWRAAVDHAISSESEFEIEYRNIWPDGGVHWVLVRGNYVVAEKDSSPKLVGVSLDVTGRKVTEEALRATEEFSRRILDSSSDCIKVLDLDFRIKYMNAPGMRVMEVDDFAYCKNANWREFWQSGDRAAIDAAIAKALAGGRGSFHAFCPTMKGTPKWWDVVVTPIKDAEGRVVKLLSSARDVTERKMVEEQLLLSQQRLALALKAGRSGSFDWDIAHNINSWSPELEDLYGIERGTFGGKLEDWAEHVIPEDLDSAMALLQQALKTGNFNTQWRIRRQSDGEIRWVDARATIMHDADGKPCRMVGIHVDVTERKQAEEQIRNAHSKLEEEVRERTVELREQVAETRRAEHSLRELTSRLLTIQDEERRRLARELHDSAGQLLTAITIDLAVVEQESASLTPRAAGAVAEAASLLQDTLCEIRTISHLLHPPLLDEAGLTSAIRWFAEGFAQRSDIQVMLNLGEDVGRLSREMETTIFRIVQESLTNIHRHSESSVAKINLSLSGNKLVVEIEDEGKGIPADKLWKVQSDGSTGVGLRGMRERVRQLGGELQIASNAKGTKLTATFLLPAQS
ncbi:MAG: hypothetical protein NVS1B11_07740 [Terriglobales bacterium]